MENVKRLQDFRGLSRPPILANACGVGALCSSRCITGAYMRSLLTLVCIYDPTSVAGFMFDDDCSGEHYFSSAILSLQRDKRYHTLEVKVGLNFIVLGSSPIRSDTCTKSPGSGQAKPEPGPLQGSGPGLGFCQALSHTSQAKALGFRAKPSPHITSCPA